jgi:hypothetical protein
MEASFYGPSKGSHHFTKEDYFGVGRDLAVSCLAYATQNSLAKKSLVVNNYLRGICGSSVPRRAAASVSETPAAEVDAEKPVVEP